MEIVGRETLALEGGDAAEVDVLQAGGGEVKNEIVLAVGLVLLLYIIELFGLLGSHLQRAARSRHFHQVEPVGAACQLHAVAVSLGVNDLHDVAHLEVGKVRERIGAGGKGSSYCRRKNRNRGDYEE